MKMKMNNKKGYSTGFGWIFGLVTLFGLGVLYIIFNQVFVAHLVPVIKNAVDAGNLIDDATKLTIYANIDKYMAFFHILPYVIFLCIIIYFIVNAVRKETEGDFR
jgi:hypothetical protein